MNEKNFEYLKDNLKYTGFGDKLYEPLEAEIKKQQPEFTLKLETEVGKQLLKTELYFRKSTDADMYFFNKYYIEMKNEKERQQVSQTFYINQGRGVTLKEAYNLLNGRTVYKELETKAGEKYHAWIKLDLSEKDEKEDYKRLRYHDNYGYHLEAILSKYPIKELMDEKQKEVLIKSLQKGNAQVVTIEMEGKDEKMFIEANPQFKTINIYEMKMQQVKKQSLQPSRGEEKKQDQIKSLNHTQVGPKEVKIEKNSRRKRQSIL